jgi:hypothetical protein
MPENYLISFNLNWYSLLLTVFNSSLILSKSSILIYSKSLAKNKRYSDSLSEPNAIFKNCANSLSEFLTQPYAILLGIETTERLICDVKPNNSSLGKVEVI